MRARIIHSDELTRYSWGAGHPMGPGRVASAMSLAGALGLLEGADIAGPDPLDEDLLRTVHSEDYLAAVRSGVAQPAFGLGTEDNPLVPGMHEIAATVAMGTVAAARAVWTGEVDRAVNIAGGLHHAMPSATSGFCVYNDCGVAIAWLKAQGARRIAYLDIDAHHGDGVQKMFYDDPDVLTISLHESPVHLFPGTGYAAEIGGRGAQGSAVNVALPPGTDDAGWLRAFDATVPPVLEAFGADILISQHGCDSHADDPLTDLSLSLDAMVASYARVAELAEEHCHGRWVATGGGGYATDTVVPRAWAHLIGVVLGRPVDPRTPIPEDWRSAQGEGAPATMGDGGTTAFESVASGYNPSSRLDQAIIATRRSVFPDLGMDPDF